MAVSEDFAVQAEPFRRELLEHCYRMLGSVQDAEDLVQETLLRAWRARGEFDGQRASLRTWLYRIATNACLTALHQRARRALPADFTGPSADAAGLEASRRSDIPWLQPFPDALAGGDPAVITAGRENIRLAFVAALQHLPPRQRAVLLLRDVLAWRAAEVAELLGTSTTAVNSALQRARARLHQVAPEDLAEPPEAVRRDLLDRYVTAFVEADIEALTRLLAEDAVLQMPPFLTWFAGRDAIGRFFASVFVAVPGSVRVIVTVANGQPAMGTYRRGDNGEFHAHSIHVLTIAGSAITRIDTFPDASLFPAFALPPCWPGKVPDRRLS